MKEFLRSEQPWGALQPAADATFLEHDDDSVLKHIIENGLASFVTLPIVGGGKTIRASLLSRYDGHEIHLMRELGVERARLVAEANISRRRVHLARKLEEDLAAASDYSELAKSLAHGISRYQGWDYVAVFALDRDAELFRMIAEHNTTGHEALPGEYSQPFTEGLLGAALRASGPIVIADTEAEATETFKVPGRR
ncbi:transcriptional regulator with GAF, ATPase, and Fis domain [Bradyrhizobium japonicum]